ncbi:MAG: hypothetical protein HON90_13035 [Halobacteriovoraceae bacterium]|nr:hypothetical protein [Halobacteriovoraceae bacterium]
MKNHKRMSCQDRSNSTPTASNCSWLFKNSIHKIRNRFTDNIIGESSSKACLRDNHLDKRSLFEIEYIDLDSFYSKRYIQPSQFVQLSPICSNFTAVEAKKYLRSHSAINKLPHIYLQNIITSNYYSNLNRIAKSQKKILESIKSISLIFGKNNINSFACKKMVTPELFKSCQAFSKCKQLPDLLEMHSKRTAEALKKLFFLKKEKRKISLNAISTGPYSALSSQQKYQKIKNFSQEKSSIESLFPWVTGTVFNDKMTDIRISQDNDLVYQSIVKETLRDQLSLTHKKLKKKLVHLTLVAKCNSGNYAPECEDLETSPITLSENISNDGSALLKIKGLKKKDKALAIYASRYLGSISCLEKQSSIRDETQELVDLSGEIVTGLGLFLIGGPLVIIGNAAKAIKAKRSVSAAIKTSAGATLLSSHATLSYSLIQGAMSKCQEKFDHVEYHDTKNLQCGKSHANAKNNIHECIEDAIVVVAPLSLSLVKPLAKKIKTKKHLKNKPSPKNTKMKREWISQLDLPRSLKSTLLKRINLNSISKSDLEKLKQTLEKNIKSNKELMHLLDDISGLRALSKAERQNKIDSLIKKFSQKKKLNTINQLILNKRHKSEIKHYNQEYAKLKKETPSISHQLANKKAKEHAIKRRNRRTEIFNSCKSKNLTPEHLKAGALYSTISLTLGISTTTLLFAEAHWNEAKNLTWAKKLGYEVFMSYLISKWGAKISKSPDGNIATKMGKSYLAANKVSGIEAGIYTVFFNNDRKSAKDHLEKVQEQANYQDFISRLVEYEKNKSNIEQIVDSVSDAGKNILETLQGKQKTTSLGKNEIMKIDKYMLDDPLVIAKLTDSIEDMMYKESLGLDKNGQPNSTSGSLLLDRFIFDAEWNLTAVPRGALVGILSYYLMCKNLDQPIKAISLAAGLQLVNKAGSTYYYYNKKEAEINQ